MIWKTSPAIIQAKNPSRSSYRSYIGKEKCPEWLTTDSVPGSFSEDHTSAQRHYQEFAEGPAGTQMSNPLRDVVASTFLTNPEFIDRVRKSAVESTSQDMRDVLALRELTERPSLEHIQEAVKSIIGTDDPLYRKLCICLGHQHAGVSLTEIGEYFGMRGPAVCQASRRFRQDIPDDKNLKKLLLGIMKGLGFVESWDLTLTSHPWLAAIWLGILPTRLRDLARPHLMSDSF